MNIYSIFDSIDGEVNLLGQGSLSVFVRLAGCNLRCSYCDTEYAQNYNKGTYMSVSEVVSEVLKYNIGKVTVTGGEPLLQRIELIDLLSELRLKGIESSVESNGSVQISKDLLNVCGCMVMDYKLPSSGMFDKMLDQNMEMLRSVDFVKFVVTDAADFICAEKICKQVPLHRRFDRGVFRPAFSCVFGVIKPAQLLEWVKTSDTIKRLRPLLNLQIHKLVDLLEAK